VEQALARSEWRDEYDEGIVLDARGAVIECVASNLFLWTRAGVLRTPALDGCGVAGVMRQAVLEAASGLGIPVAVDRFGLEAVEAAAGVFITNAVTGPRWVRQVGAWRYAKPSCLEALCRRLESDSGGPS
jgi:4-amino-4-deoxychorismate lyase